MKQIVSISLGSADSDYEFQTEFLGHKFHIRRFGTDGDIVRAGGKMLEWQDRADVIGIGNIRFPHLIGTPQSIKRHKERIRQLCSRVQIPVTTGSALRNVTHEWTVRDLQFEFDNYFTNIRALFLSGMSNYIIARSMSEFTANITFADPVLENGIPKFLKSMEDLDLYAKGAHEVLKWVPGNTHLFFRHAHPGME